MNEAKRHFIPGMWGRCGRAIPDPQASELDNVLPLRFNLRQGRDCLTPVGKYSILAGKPEPSDHDDKACATFWKVYLLSVALTAFCAVVLAFWPN